MTNQEFILTIGKVKSHTERLKHAIYDSWKKNNADFSTQGGQITSPSALKGAKEAMNDKYGPQTVEW
jgi:hypothetical protein